MVTGALRAQAAERGLGQGEFRWRGAEVSRLEALSDAVFAFAITLLVVSLEVPKSARELLDTMRGFGAFGLCFALLTQIWYDHYLYFRRYGLQDSVTLTLNAVLLFVVLFYVYPLKFLFTSLLAGLFGQEPPVEAGLGPTVMLVYALGFSAIAAVFVVLYWRALRLAEPLELDAGERFDTRWSLIGHGMRLGIGLLSALLALLRLTDLSGYIYFALGPMFYYWGVRGGALRRRIAP